MRRFLPLLAAAALAACDVQPSPVAPEPELAVAVGDGRDATEVDEADAAVGHGEEVALVRVGVERADLEDLHEVGVDAGLDESRTVDAYADSPLSIGHGQTISQPYIVALMTDLLDLAPKDTVLEIGTGSGYQAAVLAELVETVYSIEIIEELGTQAAKRLERLGIDNVTTRVGDGYYGWPEAAPFDAILVTAGAPQVPEALKDQLVDRGGTLVIPVLVVLALAHAAADDEAGLRDALAEKLGPSMIDSMWGMPYFSLTTAPWVPLPLPLGPTIPTNWLCLISRETRSTATSPPNRLVTFSSFSNDMVASK